MSWVLGLADVGWREVWTAELMAQTAAQTAPTRLTAARMAAPTAQARQETEGERKAVTEAC